MGYGLKDEERKQFSKLSILGVHTPEQMSIIDNSNGSGILDTEAALKNVDGNTDLYNKILETFIKKHAQDHSLVIQNLEQGDTEAAKRIIHSLKGVAKIVGSDDLHNISIKIDLFLVNKQFSALQEILYTFKGMLSAVINSMRIYLDKTENTMNTCQKTYITSREKSLRCIEYLAHLLKEKDMEATRQGVELVKYLPANVFTSHIVALQKDLDLLDFDNAASALQTIKQQIMADV